MWELWYQQKFGDAFDVKIGQQSIDQEFMVSQNAGYFVNTMFGWPMLPSADMPGGGPAYPLSALGVRGRAHIGDNFTLLAGIYNGSPAPNPNGDPQRADPYGVSFPLNGGVLAIAELQFAYPGPGTLVQAGEAEPLARTYKIGVWYDSEDFADLRYDNTGLPLANSDSNGTPATHRGDYAFYAVVDQMIWRSEDPDRNINVFLRPMFTPLQDRNLISLQPERRPDDARAVLRARRRHGRPRRGLHPGQQQRDGARRGHGGFYNPGVYSPIRHNETVFEATYQYQVMPWWQVQPDLQYVFNPGAGIVNPNDPTQKIKNELVVGRAHQHHLLSAIRRQFCPNEGERHDEHSTIWRRGGARRSGDDAYCCAQRRRAPTAFSKVCATTPTLASTITDNGDLNPYAVVVAPASVGKIHQGDVLVDNFNNQSNLQGTGGTIIDLQPVDPRDDAVRQTAAEPCRNVPAASASPRRWPCSRAAG